MERTEYRMGPAMEPTITPPMGRRQGEMRRGGGMRPGFLLSAFFFGAAIGGTLGLLFAPRRGSEIRETLSENLGGKGVSGEFQRRVQHVLSSGRTTPSDLVSQAERELDGLRSQAVNRLQDARLRRMILQKQAELRYLQGRERLQRMK